MHTCIHAYVETYVQALINAVVTLLLKSRVALLDEGAPLFINRDFVAGNTLFS